MPSGLKDWIGCENDVNRPMLPDADASVARRPPVWSNVSE
jgi:hypothetical protein